MQDLETLVQAQAKAEKDPLCFVEALKNGVSASSYSPPFLYHKLGGFAVDKFQF